MYLVGCVPNRLNQAREVVNSMHKPIKKNGLSVILTPYSFNQTWETVDYGVFMFHVDSQTTQLSISK
jgi:hypothetical protein